MWGQYLTPTPIGWVSEYSLCRMSITRIRRCRTSIPDLIPFPSSTPTPLANFITQEIPTQSNVAVEVAPTAAGDTILYYAQSGDWLPAVASRFGVRVNEITSPKILPEQGFLIPARCSSSPIVWIRRSEYTSAMQIIPDSELVFSATAAGF